MRDKRSINIGTANKFIIQKQAMEYIKDYPKDKTLREYARLLCWDLGISQRTALENYIEPMVEHLVLIPSGNDCYRFNNGSIILEKDSNQESATNYMKRKNKEKNKESGEKVLTKKCKQCGKLIPNDLTFCSSACIKEYRKKKEGEQ